MFAARISPKSTTVTLLYLVLLLHFAQSKTQICRILSFTKHTDPACVLITAKTAEEERYVEHFNELIVYGWCAYLGASNANTLKIKVECTNPSAIRIRFYNYFNEDKRCIKDDVATAFETAGTKFIFDARDGQCEEILPGVYYKFRIESLVETEEPLEIVRDPILRELPKPQV